MDPFLGAVSFGAVGALYSAILFGAVHCHVGQGTTWWRDELASLAAHSLAPCVHVTAPHTLASLSSHVSTTQGSACLHG